MADATSFAHLVAFLVVGLPALGLGGGLLALGLRDAHWAVASRTWPVAAGRVTGGAIRVRSGGSGGGRPYQAIVEYTYAVEGQVYRGDVVAVGDLGAAAPRRGRAYAWPLPAGHAGRRPL